MGTFWLDILSEIWISAIFVMSWSLLAKWGVHSFGQSAFLGVASYTTALLATRFDASFLAALGAALGASILCALSFGVVLVRLRGLQFLLASLAFAQLLWGVSVRWYSVTGGDNGIPGIDRPVIAGIDLSSPKSFQVFTLIVFVIAFAAFVILCRSSFGLLLDAIRTNETRVVALGLNVSLIKYVTFGISGGLAGLAGVLRAYHTGFVGPHSLSVLASADAYLMGVLGGELSPFGPVVGSAILVPLGVIAARLTRYWVFVVGVAYVVTAIAMPRGVVDASKDVGSWIRTRVTRPKGR